MPHKASRCYQLNRYSVCVVLSLLIVSLTVHAEQLTMEYTFDAPQIKIVIFGTESYDRLVMADCPNGGNVGHPALPARGARILLPPGAVVEAIEVVSGERVAIGRDFLVEPVGLPMPLSTGSNQLAVPTPDRAIYASDQISVMNAPTLISMVTAIPDIRSIRVQ